MGCCQTNSTCHILTREVSLPSEELALQYSEKLLLENCAPFPIFSVDLLEQSVKHLKESTKWPELSTRHRLFLASVLILPGNLREKALSLCSFFQKEYFDRQDLIALVDELIEVSTRVLPFNPVNSLAKTYKFHYYIASLAKVKSKFQQVCLDELGWTGLTKERLVEQFVQNINLGSLLASSTLRGRLWELFLDRPVTRETYHTETDIDEMRSSEFTVFSLESVAAGFLKRE